MFTGIVGGVGRIVRIEEFDGGSSQHGKRLAIEAPPGFLDDVALGDSISIAGACMTVTSFDAGAARFSIDISAESLSKTAGLDRPGPVNLEKALRASDRLGGHLVSGHVDGLGRVVRFEPFGESWRLAIAMPRELGRFMAVKGSIVVDGTSLTVNRVEDGTDATEVEINLIPHTLATTTLGSLEAGRAVNLEIDLIARYVERLLAAR
ncbi:MAG TPA: riboflavin synthase [Methylibium sp.]|uniref:riboflavin synthase n=1 Tax=Methylibium sp. TaxID=2067992 RepID=UPI002DBC5396|nr:riboflavin synthase [Methylibium sp.]HEU4457536.1 riboflavin synthase [Methylibium sp.]